jgi:hypothetical protein
MRGSQRDNQRRAMDKFRNTVKIKGKSQIETVQSVHMTGVDLSTWKEPSSVYMKE